MLLSVGCICEMNFLSIPGMVGGNLSVVLLAWSTGLGNIGLHARRRRGLRVLFRRGEVGGLSAAVGRGDATVLVCGDCVPLVVRSDLDIRW